MLGALLILVALSAQGTVVVRAVEGSMSQVDVERQAALDGMAWVEQAYAERLGMHGADWRAQVRTRESMLLGSLDWLMRNGEGDQALRLAVPLAYFWTYDGRPGESRDLFAKVLALPSAAAPTTVRARALYDAALLAFGQGDQQSARVFNEASLRIYRRLDDKSGIALALAGLSRVALRDLDYAAVRRYAEESGVLLRDLGDTRGHANAVHMLAAIARMQGQYARAAELYQFSLDANREAGYEDAVAAEIFELGYVRLRQGKVAEARNLFTDSLQKYRSLEDDAGIAYNLTGFAAIAVEQKQPTRAARLYGSALALLDQLNVTIDPDDQLEIDHYTAKLLTLIAPDAFEAGTTVGRTASPERAIALALGAP
jgi:tetratricopeptide (TPR) repeat protein